MRYMRGSDMLNFYSFIHSTHSNTGCSLNIVFFPKILKYSGLLPFSVLPRCQCVFLVSVCTHTRQETSAAAELAEFRKIQNFKEKTHYLMKTLYLILLTFYRFLFIENYLYKIKVDLDETINTFISTNTQWLLHAGCWTL